MSKGLSEEINAQSDRELEIAQATWGNTFFPKRAGAKSAGVRMHCRRAGFFLAILVLTATYLAGGYSARHQLFPFPFFQALKTRVSGTAPDLYTFDQAGRLASGDQESCRLPAADGPYGRAVADRAVQRWKSRGAAVPLGSRRQNCQFLRWAMLYRRVAPIGI